MPGPVAVTAPDEEVDGAVGLVPVPAPPILVAVTTMDVDGIGPETQGGSCGDVGGVVDTIVVVIIGITSSGELWPDDSVAVAVRLSNSASRSSIRPIRWAIRCISKRMSTFMSITVAIKSRWASVLAVSRKPVSYVSEVDARDEAISICRSRSNDKFRSKCSRSFCSRSVGCRSSDGRWSLPRKFGALSRVACGE